MAYQYDVFISYEREPLAAEWTKETFRPTFESFLRQELGKKDLKIFIDEQGIGGGQYWETTLKHALATSKCLVPVLMTSYFQSEWCVREFAVMHHRQERLVRKPQGLIVPFVIWDGDSFPDPAKAIQQIDCKTYYNPAKAFRKTTKFVDFQEKLKEWVIPVAKAVRAAPAWSEDWLSNEWLDLPIDNFLIPDDLTILQPRNI